MHVSIITQLQVTTSDWVPFWAWRVG